MPWTSTNRIYAKPSNTASGEDVGGGSVTARSGPTAAADSGGRFELSDHGYGKCSVKLLHVHRDGDYHSIREFEVNTELKLASESAYVLGDNKEVVATDSQKNTVYLLAKKHGVKTPEEFGAVVVNHFLYMYKQVVEAKCRIVEYPWERLQAGVPHNHAFVFSPTATRWSEVSQARHEAVVVKSGLSGLRVLKTTQSAFVDFVQDEYTTLADAAERIFSTVVEAEWTYDSMRTANFDNAWLTVKDAILDKFAGPPDTGVYSPSVQHTLYQAEKVVLEKVSEITWIRMTMPNKHYLNIDMSKFPANVTKGDPRHHIYQPIDKPAGLIYAQLRRRPKSRL
ncbi:uricase [Hyposmocoma kahamanoa]|uniref:uricase n=1 Tax=Hyposmocoma kahamanoa TaxID=1477025 RepID=UPI000E6DA462|nr:uricase [Hyposmocoma kahamanoa]